MDELLAGIGARRPGPARPPVRHRQLRLRASTDEPRSREARGISATTGDLDVFRALRREVDAVLAGTGTLRAEQYGRILKLPESRERRRRRGLAPEPLAITLTRGGDVPLDIPLFAEPEAEVVVFSGSEIDVSGVAAQVEVVVLDPPDLGAALRHLRADHGVRVLLCEGGPSVLAALVRERLWTSCSSRSSPSSPAAGRAGPDHRARAARAAATGAGGRAGTGRLAVSSLPLDRINVCRRGEAATIRSMETRERSASPGPRRAGRGP